MLHRGGPQNAMSSGDALLDLAGQQIDMFAF
jgi:hypothetical protein